MKICDKCGEPVERVILDKKTGGEYDLCRGCAEDFEAFMSTRKVLEKPEEDKPEEPEKTEEPQPQETKRRPGRPRKEP